MSQTRPPLGGARAPIVITGLGLTSAAGNGMESLIRSIENGDSHVDRLRNVDVSDLPSTDGTEIRDQPRTCRVPRFEHYLELALTGALDDAEADPAAEPLNGAAASQTRCRSPRSIKVSHLSTKAWCRPLAFRVRPSIHAM